MLCNLWTNLEVFIGHNETTIIAISAIFASITAISSLFLTIFSLKSQNKHNRISIKPLCSFPIADYENRITIKVQNDGLGPLLIKKFELIQNNHTIEHGQLVQLMPAMPESYHWETFATITKGQIIPSQNSRTILSLLIDDNDPKLLAYANDVRKALGTIQLKCDYSDLYEIETYSATTLLDWYLRRWV